MSAIAVSGPKPGRRAAWLFAAIVLVGALLRLDQIADQIPADDEWHALHTFPDHGYGWILSHFGSCDFCIPLTLFEKLVADRVGLSELGMRALPLLAGLSALVVLPMLVRDLGTKVALGFAALLAISPIHVHFSRMARPYSVTFLLGATGALAFHRWWEGGRRRWAVLYAACAVLGPWFHGAVAPFVLAPLAWGAVLLLVGRLRKAPRSGRSLLELVLLGLAVALGLALLLGPPIATDLSTLAARSIGRSDGGAPWERAFELWTGTSRALLGFAFGLALLLGILELRRRSPGWLAYALFLCAAQLSTIAIARPDGLESPIAVARYGLPVLAPLLAVAAVGLVRLDELARAELRWLPAHLPSCVLCASLLAFGPLPRIDVHPNDWTNHAVYQYGYSPFHFQEFAKRALKVEGVPEVYLRIARESDPEDLVVEAPWHYDFVAYPVYQRFHRRRVLIGFVTPPGDPLPLGELDLRDPRFALRKFVHVGDVARLRARGVRYVIFHREPAPPSDRHVRLADVERWIETYRAEVGAPIQEDAAVCAFDLARGDPVDRETR